MQLVSVISKIPLTTHPQHTLLLFIYNGDYNEKQAQKQNILEKSIYVSPSAILRPPCNSNVAKESLIKWSHKFIWVSRSHASGLPKDLKNYGKASNLTFF